ncbi:MAG: ABC transporter ATP-binding protein [Alphaproteobacteria bacterium]|nr:ABC transporter ATP-binding protein [Alphaproteobacteria bacterium]
MLALDAISFDVQRGHLASLLGASGCGKTTLLRIAAGLIHADGGGISIDAARVQAPRNDVCMVFQNFGLLPWRSVLDNVAFPLELDGVAAAERYAAARHYIEIVGLAGFESQYPHELSGGMQQRVGIARALVRKPKVLLMDEPFAALDAQTRETLQEDFLRIWQEFKTTVLFVTHSIDEALVLSDRVVVFTPRPGRVHRIIDAPLGANRFDGDPRALPEFGRWRHEIRDMLRHEALQ